jgi:hypothetical protein
MAKLKIEVYPQYENVLKTKIAYSLPANKANKRITLL